MSGQSAIEWTEATWNPVTGCDRVSPGCAHCYALELAPRLRAMGNAKYQGARDGDLRTSGPAFGVTLHPDVLDQPLRRRKPTMWFVNSMSDLFHEEVPDEFILAVWAVMEAAPQHTYQILTKRPGRMRDLLGRERPAPPPQPDYVIRPIPCYPGYYANTDGEIFSGRRGQMKQLKPDASQQGHQRVSLFGDGSRRGNRHLVHRLILLTFDRAPEDGEQACHRDGDPTNNRISNLYWGTQSDNWADSKRHGTGRRYSVLAARSVAYLRIQALEGTSAEELGRRFGISATQARNIIRGDQWGFKVLPSAWLGVSIENRRFVHRVDVLRETPAAVRFISAEPLLGPLVHEQGCLDDFGASYWYDGYDGRELDLRNIDWLIVGGESGPNARRMDPGWVEDLRDAAEATHIFPTGTTAFFFKQWGGRTPKSGGRELAGRTWDEFPAATDQPREALDAR